MISRANESALEEQPEPVKLEIDLKEHPKEHPEEHPEEHPQKRPEMIWVTHHLLSNGKECGVLVILVP